MRVLDEFGCAKRDATVGARISAKPKYVVAREYGYAIGYKSVGEGLSPPPANSVARPYHRAMTQVTVPQ